MCDKHRILAVIPARGNSKGIPRKNIRLLAGKPLIAYSIENAIRSEHIDDVVVTSDDEEIIEIAKIYGAEVINRPISLARDKVPLDPVIFHATSYIEKKKGITYDYVISIQPTSPLLKRETLDRAILDFVNNGSDTLIAVRDATHLYWTQKKGKFLPLYEKRLNRQFLDKIYQETGSILITKRGALTNKSRIGSSIELFEIPPNECIDIDTFQDWWIAENLLKQTTVVFRVDGTKEMGLGHVYRAITLANRMFNQTIYFFMDRSKKLGIEKVKEYNYPIILIDDERDFLTKLNELQPQIVINDILDTTEEYIQKLKDRNMFVVNFEDLGSGSEIANLVINALYEKTEPPEKSYYGPKYVCLRDEFHVFPRHQVNQKVSRLLILFGGSDPNNLTFRTIKAIEKLGLDNLHTSIVLGLGYRFKNELYPYIDKLKSRGFDVEIKENVKIIAKLISESDIVITSNGRTVYEVATIGVPCISISQNEREVRHLFSHTCRGIMNLGLESKVTIENIATALEKLISDFDLRRKMSQELKNFDLRKGTDAVVKIILDNYWETKT